LDVAVILREIKGFECQIFEKIGKREVTNPQLMGSLLGVIQYQIRFGGEEE